MPSVRCLRMHRIPLETRFNLVSFSGHSVFSISIPLVRLYDFHFSHLIASPQSFRLFTFARSPPCLGQTATPWSLTRRTCAWRTSMSTQLDPVVPMIPSAAHQSASVPRITLTCRTRHHTQRHNNRAFSPTQTRPSRRQQSPARLFPTQMCRRLSTTIPTSTWTPVSPVYASHSRNSGSILPAKTTYRPGDVSDRHTYLPSTACRHHLCRIVSRPHPGSNHRLLAMLVLAPMSPLDRSLTTCTGGVVRQSRAEMAGMPRSTLVPVSTN